MKPAENIAQAQSANAMPASSFEIPDPVGSVGDGAAEPHAPLPMAAAFYALPSAQDEGNRFSAPAVEDVVARSWVAELRTPLPMAAALYALPPAKDDGNLSSAPAVGDVAARLWIAPDVQSTLTGTRDAQTATHSVARSVELVGERARPALVISPVETRYRPTASPSIIVPEPERIDRHVAARDELGADVHAFATPTDLSPTAEVFDAPPAGSAHSRSPSSNRERPEEQVITMRGSFLPPDWKSPLLAGVTSGMTHVAAAPAAVGDAAIGPDYQEVARRTAKFIGLCFAGWIALIVALMIVYRFVNPPISSLMLQQMLTGEAISHEWAALENISPNIVRAVVASEDGRFCEHNGVDFVAIKKVMDRAGSGNSMRGASTVSMQVVKNLFLWPSKSILRKAIEFPLTYVLELLWPKRRIMEVYLNIVEWGPGVFGIASASEFHFHKPAAQLSERDAARLAVALPNPIERNAGRPGPGTLRLAQYIQFRMRMTPASQTACVLGAARNRR